MNIENVIIHNTGMEEKSVIEKSQVRRVSKRDKEHVGNR